MKKFFNLRRRYSLLNFLLVIHFNFSRFRTCFLSYSAGFISFPVIAEIIQVMVINSNIINVPSKK